MVGDVLALLCDDFLQVALFLVKLLLYVQQVVILVVLQREVILEIGGEVLRLAGEFLDFDDIGLIRFTNLLQLLLVIDLHGCGLRFQLLFLFVDELGAGSEGGHFLL